MDTNLVDLPWGTVMSLSRHLSRDDLWLGLTARLPPEHRLPPDLIESLRQKPNPAQQWLITLGNRGFTVKTLLKHLDKCRHVESQLVLRRKFVPIKLTHPARQRRSATHIVLECKATGFPYPTYEWTHLDNSSVIAQSATVTLPLCSVCTRVGEYQCRITNAIPTHSDWSADYDRAPPTSSSLVTDRLSVQFNATKDAPVLCDHCHQQRTWERVNNLQLDDDPAQTGTAALNTQGNGTEATPAALTRQAAGGGAALFDITCSVDCVATDKVALIISNSAYTHLPPLHTPPCDAHTLADTLLALDFKTVTVCDLTIEEMKRVMLEYTKLLGAGGVYAVFYFVGHGFEHHGQCYLLPVDAPSEDYSCSDCLCVDWLLARMQTHEPNLNLILLDMCRKTKPANVDDFLKTAEHVEYRVNRNTVFGYATSGGEGAFEVKGEVNGIFMKYLKQYITQRRPVLDALHRVQRDLEKDPKASKVQFPELRSNLSRPLSLTDPLVTAGHTASFDQRTLHWQNIHELPDPMIIDLETEQMRVTLWFGYCGHFCNLMFAFSCVTELRRTDDSGHLSCEGAEDAVNKAHVARLSFEKPVECCQTIMCTDREEGQSMRTMVKHLQKVQVTSNVDCDCLWKSLDKVSQILKHCCDTCD